MMDSASRNMLALLPIGANGMIWESSAFELLQFAVSRDFLLAFLHPCYGRVQSLRLMLLIRGTVTRCRE